MKGRNIKIIAMVLAMLVTVLLADNIAPAASAVNDSSKLSFVLKADDNLTNAKTGDTVVLSLYITNNTGAPINNFNGNISFNGNFFNFLEITDDKTGSRLTFNEENAKSSNIVTFTYADSSKSLISNGTRDLLLFKVRFLVVNRVNTSGSGSNIKVHIERCDNDNNVIYSDIISQVQIALSTTATPTTATTAPRSSNTRLSSLEISSGTLSPAFDPDFVAYCATVDASVAEIRVSANAEISSSVVDGIGVKPLSFGSNSLTVTVTAEDGTQRQYGLIIIRSDEAVETVVDIGDDVSVVIDNSYDIGEAVIIPSDTDVPNENEEKGFLFGNTIKIIGAISAIIALFFFGYLSGFFTDKSIKKRDVFDQSLKELGINLDDYNDLVESPYPEELDETYSDDIYSDEEY